MTLILQIAAGVLGTIAAIIAIIGVFPSELTTDQKLQIGTGIFGWFIALCCYIAYVIVSKKNASLKTSHQEEISALKITHKTGVKAIKAQHAVEKTALERNMAKDYEKFLATELGKTSTALVYTSKLLSPESPIPRSTNSTQGNQDEF
ncbi:hypothetical protein ABV540_004255 [Vibrio fluvialis]|nr:hypothetical protein [Vibrio fluvialis]